MIESNLVDIIRAQIPNVNGVRPPGVGFAHDDHLVLDDRTDF